MAGAHARVVQGPDRFQGAQHAELAVVLAAGGDRVDVRAHHHGRLAGLTRALAEDVAHLVHRDSQPGLAHPGDHEVAAALVLVAEGQAREAAPLGGADASQLLHGPFEPRAIDPHVASQRGL